MDDLVQGQKRTPKLSSADSTMTRELLQNGDDDFPVEDFSIVKEIDLNELFPDLDINLNELFPDSEVKLLLKSITKNKRDMEDIKERLSTENATADEVKEGALSVDVDEATFD